MKLLIDDCRVVGAELRSLQLGRWDGNTLVVGPGNYSFGDFVRVGVPLTVIVMAVSVVLVPLLLPFR